MKAAIYVRVSTDKQEVENQLIDLRRYCEASGWEIFHEYADIMSGAETRRPAFAELFRAAHQRRFDALLFWDLSRFSRSGTLYTLQKFKELDNLGIKWHSYQEPMISSLGDWGPTIISSR